MKQKARSAQSPASTRLQYFPSSTTGSFSSSAPFWMLRPSSLTARYTINCRSRDTSGCLWLSFLFSCSPFSCFFLPFPFPAAIPLPPSYVHARQAERKPLQEGSFLPTRAVSGLSGGRASEAVVPALILMPRLFLLLIVFRFFSLIRRTSRCPRTSSRASRDRRAPSCCPCRSVRRHPCCSDCRDGKLTGPLLR